MLVLIPKLYYTRAGLLVLIRKLTIQERTMLVLIPKLYYTRAGYARVDS